MKSQLHPSPGTVYLIGAGPGDPDLITVRGAEILKEADVIVYDRLANPDLLSYTRTESEHIYVGKRPGKPSVSQNQINQILASKAREEKSVARLKGGDSFVFGRGGEECEALAANGVPFEVVPGISSSLAAPAYAGIPLTYRNEARSFTVVTGHILDGENPCANWEYLVHADTLVILMGMKNLGVISEKLIQFGRHPGTPVAVIERATYEEQNVVVGRLDNISDKTKELSSPATIVVGEMVDKGRELAWFRKSLDQPELQAEFNSKFVG